MLSGCTASFCSNLDRANMAYPYEQGVTVYVDKDDVPADYAELAWAVYGEEGNDTLYAYIPVDQNGNYTAKNATLVNDLVASMEAQRFIPPSYEYFKAIDQLVLDAAVDAAIDNGEAVDKATLTAEDVNPWSAPDVLGTEEGIEVNEDSLLRRYGFLKFYGYDEEGNGNLWINYDKWNDELAISLGAENAPSFDWITAYKNQINSAISTNISCITNIEGSFGHYGPQQNWEVSMEVKDWGYAWSPRRITVSSVGLAKGLERFLAESECHLAISLHHPLHEGRAALMPAERAFPISDVAATLRRSGLFSKGPERAGSPHQRRLSFEYIPFEGVNDSPRHARAVVDLLRGLDCRVNLIRFHGIPGTPLRGITEGRMVQFRDYLTGHGIFTTIRASRGEDIMAACGLLSTARQEAERQAADREKARAHNP